MTQSQRGEGEGEGAAIGFILKNKGGDQVLISVLRSEQLSAIAHEKMDYEMSLK
jgi:hypothetical protein